MTQNAKAIAAANNANIFYDYENIHTKAENYPETVTELSNHPGVNIDNEKKTIAITVNSINDETSNTAVNFGDTEVTLREALLLAHHQDSKKVKTARDKKVFINFSDQPTFGSINQEGMPPWLIYLQSPLPTIHGGVNITFNEQNPQPIHLSPQKDTNNQIKAWNHSMLTVGHPAYFYATPKDEGGSAPLDYYKLIAQNDQYKPTEVHINRINFIRNDLTAVTPDGGAGGGMAAGSAISLVEGKLYIQNSTLQGLSVKGASGVNGTWGLGGFGYNAIDNKYATRGGSGGSNGLPAGPYPHLTDFSNTIIPRGKNLSYRGKGGSGTANKFWSTMSSLKGGNGGKSSRKIIRGMGGDGGGGGGGGGQAGGYPIVFVFGWGGRGGDGTQGGFGAGGGAGGGTGGTAASGGEEGMCTGIGCPSDRGKGQPGGRFGHRGENGKASHTSLSICKGANCKEGNAKSGKGGEGASLGAIATFGGELYLNNVLFKNNQAKGKHATSVSDLFAYSFGPKQSGSDKPKPLIYIGEDVNITQGGTIKSLSEIDNKKVKLIDNTKAGEAEANQFRKIEPGLKSYIYDKEVSEVQGVDPPVKLSKGISDSLEITYDSPRSGAIALFSDFSGILGELQRITKEQVNSRPDGTDREKIQKEGEQKRMAAFLGFGLNMASSVIGEVTGGDDDPVGRADAPNVPYSSLNTIEKMFRGARKNINKGLAKIGSKSFTSAAGLAQGLKKASFGAGLIMQGVQLGMEIEKLNEEQYQSELKAIANKEFLTNKLNQYSSGAFDPNISLNLKSIKSQRKPVVIHDFIFGEDLLYIPMPERESDITFNKIFDSENRSGFSIDITQPNVEEHDFRIAKVYIHQDQVNNLNNTDIASLASDLTNTYKNKSGTLYSWVLGQGYLEEQYNTTKSQDFTGPVHTPVTVNRKGKYELDTTIETITSGGHDRIIGDKGNESINTEDGNDTVFQNGGADTINAATGIDAIVYHWDNADPFPLSFRADSPGSTTVSVKPLSKDDESLTKEIKQWFTDNPGATAPLLNGTLKHFEIFQAPAHSDLDFTNLGPAQEFENSAGDAVYKFRVTSGTKLVGSKYNDVVEYLVPEITNKDDLATLKLTTIDGNGTETNGKDQLYIDQELLKSNQTIKVNYTAGSETSGSISLTVDGQSKDIVTFSEIHVHGNDGSPDQAGTISQASDLQEDWGDDENRMINRSLDNTFNNYTKFNAIRLGDNSDNNFKLYSPNKSLNIKGSHKPDKINAGHKSDKIWSRKGNDIINGLTGNDKIYGGNNDDWIMGDQGKDKLFGGRGNDTLNGGAGNDILDGGNGRDSFIYELNSGRDTIKNFNHRKDNITIYAPSRKRVRELKDSIKLISGSKSSKSDLRIIAKGISIRLPGLTDTDVGRHSFLESSVEIVPQKNVMG